MSLKFVLALVFVFAFGSFVATSSFADDFLPLKPNAPALSVGAGFSTPISNAINSTGGLNILLQFSAAPFISSDGDGLFLVIANIRQATVILDPTSSNKNPVPYLNIRFSLLSSSTYVSDNPRVLKGLTTSFMMLSGEVHRDVALGRDFRVRSDLLGVDIKYANLFAGGRFGGIFQLVIEAFGSVVDSSSTYAYVNDGKPIPTDVRIGFNLAAAEMTLGTRLRLGQTVTVALVGKAGADLTFAPDFQGECGWPYIPDCKDLNVMSDQFANGALHLYVLLPGKRVLDTNVEIDYRHRTESFYDSFHDPVWSYPNNSTRFMTHAGFTF